MMQQLAKINTFLLYNYIINFNAVLLDIFAVEKCKGLFRVRFTP